MIFLCYQNKQMKILICLQKPNFLYSIICQTKLLCMHMLGILAAAEILNKAAADNSSNSYLKNVMKFIILILNNGK